MFSRARFLTPFLRTLSRPRHLFPILAFTLYSFTPSKAVESAPPSTHSPQIYEITIDADLIEGEVREIQVGPTKDDTVLVCKVNSKYYCVQSKCPHFGLPLAKSLLLNDKIICPFHNASFSVETGYPEGGPVFNGLAHYEITENEGKLFIKVDAKRLNVSETVAMSTRNPEDKRRYVIIGGGPAGLSCAETLRQAGYEGEILMITDENTVPYDRTMLSKWIFGSSVDKLLLRKQEFFDQYGIEVVKNTHVTHVDYDRNEVLTQDFKTIKYDKLLLATGGSPRRPAIPGNNLQNILVLRNVADQVQLQTALNSGKVTNIVVVGASFIGMETAAAIKNNLKDKVNITVVDIVKTPFEKSLGSQVGSSLESLHRKNGINFILEQGIKNFNGKENHVESITLTNGSNLPADLVILGTGIAPNTILAQNSLKLTQNGGIETDAFLRTTTKKNVFAAGDVASFPYWVTGEHIRIEHYNEAIQQGAVAGLNMVDRYVPMDQIAFFWTRQWDKGLQYTGFAGNYDDIIVQGDLNEQNFAAFYLKNDKVVAVAAMNKMNLVQIANEAMRLNVMPKGSEIRDGKGDLNEIKKRVDALRPASKCKKADCCKNK